MSELFSWVLKIVGVVVIGVLVDIIMPEGQTNKYIKSIFACFTLLVIVSPLPKLLNYDIENSLLDNSSESVSVDEDFLNYYESLYEEECKNKIKTALNEDGYEVKDIELTLTRDENNVKILEKIKVYIDKKSVINWEKEHINIISKIKQIINKGVIVEVYAE